MYHSTVLGAYFTETHAEAEAKSAEVCGHLASGWHVRTRALQDPDPWYRRGYRFQVWAVKG